MKKIITAVGLFAALMASPAFARSAHKDYDPSATFRQYYQDPDALAVQGEEVGRDPDALVRQEMGPDGPELRDGSSGG